MMFVALCFLPSAAAAQSVSQGQSWDAIKALPDWDGVWAAAGNASSRGMSFTPAGKAQNDNLNNLRGDNGDVPSRHKKCILAGFPSGMTGPEQYTIEFVYTPGQVTITDSQAFVRRIYTDGRKHHPGPDTLMGDSIGHWEKNMDGGAALVVDTIDLDAGNELFYGFTGGKGVHITERMALNPQDHLSIDSVIEAPEMLTKPAAHNMLYNRHRDWTTVEMDCAQNNRSVDANGNQTMILDRY
jgi:hypothetical protein